MQSGYYNVTGGMVTQFNRLDTIANNLANVNSAGFKEDKTIIGDFMKVYKQSRDELELKNQTIDGAKFYNRTMNRTPQVSEVYTDFSMGAIQKTDNPLDVSLTREGLFFAVKTPDGIKLTRDGSFSLDDTGKLITKQGYEVLPSDYMQTKQPMQFSVDQAYIEMDANGMFSANQPGTTTFNQVKQLMVVSPENMKMLKKEGDGLFSMDPAEIIKPNDETGALKQGYIEKSNVNPIVAMTSLIETNRLVTMYQKVMQTQMDDMNRDAITKIAAKAV
ncbi:MAG: flagellar hook-basal body protein [Campylobacterota bacterium]|nr:flagellar hook-basal body protein [Campylobacterota bacterium]